MESFNIEYAGETERAKHKKLNFQNKTIRSVYFVHWMCSGSTFIQVHTDYQKYWCVLQCSSMNPYTNSQNIFPRGISVQRPPGLLSDPAFRLHTRFTHPIYTLVYAPNVELVSQQPFLGFHSSEILCIVGIVFPHWNLLQGRLLLGKNIRLCHPIKVRMEKAHVALLHQLISPLQPYYNGILSRETNKWRKIMHGPC